MSKDCETCNEPIDPLIFLPVFHRGQGAPTAHIGIENPAASRQLSDIEVSYSLVKPVVYISGVARNFRQGVR